MSDAYDSDIFLIKNDLRLSVTNPLPEHFITVVCRSSWIADSHRATRISDSKTKHIRKLPFILRSHHRHIRNHGQVGQIEDSLVGLPVASNQSAPVHRKDDRKILECNIMDDLVKGPL